MLQLLFVYGTLHPDRAPAEILGVVRRLKLLGPGAIQGTLHDLGPYPGLTLTGDQLISGHLFALPEDPTVLAALDAYESFYPADPEASLFLRVAHTVTLPDGTGKGCWVYIYNRPLTEAG
jgi:gamma-glutamylcyclotransferase (GGCT)/AIG2-like uncharacterized protein YtfP